MSQLVYPIAINFEDWVGQMRQSFPAVYLPSTREISQWREWASQVVGGNNIPNLPLPTHLAFPLHENWREWACYFINSLSFPSGDSS